DVTARAAGARVAECCQVRAGIRYGAQIVRAIVGERECVRVQIDERREVPRRTKILLDAVFERPGKRIIRVFNEYAEVPGRGRVGAGAGEPETVAHALV